MKSWEIIADNLHKAGWSLGWVSTLDTKDEQFGLWTRIATESVSSCQADEILIAFLELESVMP
jgi:hypothetical protein